MPNPLVVWLGSIAIFPSSGWTGSPEWKPQGFSIPGYFKRRRGAMKACKKNLQLKPLQMWPVERFMLIHEAREAHYSFIAR
jgi:hypothetical protein